MRQGILHPLVWLLLALATSSAALAVAARDPVQDGWAPFVRLYGRGDTTTTVKALQKLTAAYTTALHHTEIDEPTQAFIDGLVDDFGDFELDSFHERLPEQVGQARELRIRGDLLRNRYLVQRADAKRPFKVSLDGPRTELAAMSTLVRSTPARGYGDRPSYLLSGHHGIGVGDVSWDAATESFVDLARLLSEGKLAGAEAPEPSDESRRRVRALHPRVADEDLAILALLFEAYPQLSATVSRLGQVENVRTTWPGKSYQQITIKMRGDLARFGEHYPALAKHFSKLDDILHCELTWLDKQGRTLATAKLDSDKLIFELAYFVKGGKLLPSRGGRVVESEPLEYLGDAFDHTHTVVKARFKMLGVVVKVDHLILDNWYAPHQSYAEMGTAMRSVPPVIDVEGAALGFLPTGLLDAFIPGNIASITRDFFEVAARGNGQKGVVMQAKLGSRGPGEGGVVESSVALEALDNFMVKIGIGMVNEKLLPNDKAFRDVKQLATDMHDGFVRDLARYATRTRGG